MSAAQDPLRHVPFEGTPNFRDFGGYPIQGGGRVKWRSLFRSGQLASLTESDLNQLAILDIRLVFDFRHEHERLKDPSQFPECAMPKVVDLPIDPGSSFNFLGAIAEGELTPEDMAEFMCRINREFVYNQSAHYRRMFEHMLEQPEGASLIHCSAGKDRTGYAAAMILSALGVSRDIVMQDYLLTSNYFDIDREISRVCKKYGWEGDAGAMRPLLEVREQYLRAAFDAIEEQFPNLDDYLDEVLGLGREARELLRERHVDL